jgi:hypothetical protein
MKAIGAVSPVQPCSLCDVLKGEAPTGLKRSRLPAELRSLRCVVRGRDCIFNAPWVSAVPGRLERNLSNFEVNPNWGLCINLVPAEQYPLPLADDVTDPPCDKAPAPTGAFRLF